MSENCALIYLTSEGENPFKDTLWRQAKECAMSR